MGFTMLSILVAIRNFTVAILLAWMGFSVAPSGDDKKESVSTAPNGSVLSFVAG